MGRECGRSAHTGSPVLSTVYAVLGPWVYTHPAAWMCHDLLAGTPDPNHGSVPGGPRPSRRKCSLTRYYGASCQAGRCHRTAVGSEVGLL